MARVSPFAWVPAFVLVGVVWGTSFLFIKVAVGTVPPPYIALGRIGLGALTLLGYLTLRRQSLPRDPRLWLHLCVFAAFSSSVPFALFGYAEERVSSVLAGIWNGTAPLTTLAVTLIAFRAHRPGGQQLAGLGLGFAGVLVVLGVWHGLGGSSLVGQAALLGAVCCYGIAFNYTRVILRRWPITALQLSVGQLLMGTLHLLILAPLLAGAPPAPWHLSWRVLGSIAALGILGTGIAFTLNYHVIQTAGVTTGSMVTYLPPVVAAVAGVTLLHERLSWNQPLGGLIVLLGVGVSQGLFLARARRGPDRSLPRANLVRRTPRAPQGAGSAVVRPTERSGTEA
jgi:drug/metabolite transporter (DMT)-like permease